MKNKKSLIIICTSLIALAVVSYIFINRETPEQKQQKINQQQETAQNQQKKEQFINSTNDTGNPKTNSDNGSNNPQPQPSIVSSITANQQNNSVVVLTKVTGLGSGDCSLTINNGQSSTKKTTALIYQPEFSSCAGFNIPVNEIGQGNWQISLEILQNSKKVSEASTSIEAK